MFTHNAILVRDRMLGALFGVLVILVLFVFGQIIVDIVGEGVAVFNWTFLTEVPALSGREGGIFPILVSTFAVVGIAVFSATPLGILTALLLAEFTKSGSLYGSLIRKSLEVLAAVPSIVFGLFGNAFFCLYLGMGFSILSGGLTLACMVLPIIIRTTEEGLRAVPSEYRQGVYALGFSKCAAVFQLLLPWSVPGLTVGVILGFGRAIAETAALIFTAGYVDRTPESFLDSGRVLSVHIYDLAMNIPGGDPMAYGSSLLLVIIIAVVSVVTSVLVKQFFARGMMRA
jgi:phosphate transport system permease protein